MHSSEVNELDGKFSDSKPASGACPKCGNASLRFQIWESSCGGYVRWIDGIDS